jgi:PPOX class probable F420-dependent enzyme
MSGVGGFREQKYLSLETYRASGIGVRTPVWFAAAPGPTLYIYSAADSGKAKRIRRSGVARVAACDIRGNVSGSWVDAQATIVGPDEFRRAMPLLNRKYWPWKAILDLLMKFRPGDRRIVIAIREKNGAVGGD